MRRRGKHTRYDRITARMPILALVLALSLLSFSCAGGSGSSGFDLAENAAIEMALDEQRCVESEGLTICPAGMATQPAPGATATRTATPLQPTPTPTGPVIDVPTETPATPPVQRTATVTPPSTATPTPTVDLRMSVDTSFDGTEGSPCIPTDAANLCLFPFLFTPQGFSAGTNYQVAARGTDDEPWELFDAVDVSLDAPATIFEADILIDTLVQSPTGSVVLQTAVLVFVDQPPFLPAMELIERLAESGADFAFVNPEQTIPIQ